MANPSFRAHVGQGLLELVRNLQPSGFHPAVTILGDDIGARRPLKTGDTLVVDEPRIRVHLFDDSRMRSRSSEIFTSTSSTSSLGTRLPLVRRARMERQVLGRDRFVAQNNPVVCKEESASFIKELLILHIAVEDVLAVLYVRPMLRRLRAPA